MGERLRLRSSRGLRASLARTAPGRDELEVGEPLFEI
jgi:hypothetical protein